MANALKLMGVSIGAVLVACQSMPAPNDTLEDARNALASAQNQPAVVRSAPIELEQAQQALLRAERAWVKEAEADEVRHLAYIAARRVAIALDAAAHREAQEQLRQATLELERIRAQVREAAARGAPQPPMAEAPVPAGVDDEVPTAPPPISRREAGDAPGAVPDQTAALARRLEPLAVRSTPRGLMVNLPASVFGSGDVAITAQARDALERLAGAMREFPERRLVVEGFTDALGTDEAGRARSGRRAEAFRQALAGHGVAVARLEAHGLGAAYPVADNATPAGRQLNERLEVWFSDARGHLPPR
jgi:outer membrane protein OmpA-like peptidoglycan-associated protein